MRCSSCGLASVVVPNAARIVLAGCLGQLLPAAVYHTNGSQPCTRVCREEVDRSISVKTPAEKPPDASEVTGKTKPLESRVSSLRSSSPKLQDAGGEGGGEGGGGDGGG